MKSILYILIILLVATAVSTVTYILVENSSSSAATEMVNPEGEMPVRPEGEHHEGGEHGSSFGGGMMGVLSILAKVASFTAMVFLLEKVFSFFQKQRVSPALG